MILIAAISAGTSPNDTRRLADISIIWQITFVMIGMFIWLITLIVSIYAVYKVTQILPVQSFRLLRLLSEVKTRLEKLSNQSVEPIMKMKTSAASIKRVFKLRPGR